MLEKRLEAHMSELAAHDSDVRSGSKKQGRANATTGLSAEHQGEKERVIAKAALTIAELGILLHVELPWRCIHVRIGALLDEGPSDPESGHPSRSTDASEERGSTDSIPLRSVTAVAAYIAFISDARTRVTREMEAMVIRGLTSLASLLSPHRNTGGADDECG